MEAHSALTGPTINAQSDSNARIHRKAKQKHCLDTENWNRKDRGVYCANKGSHTKKKTK